MHCAHCCTDTATPLGCGSSLINSRQRLRVRRLALEELEQRLVLSNYSLGVISEDFSMDGLEVSPEAGSDTFALEFAEGGLYGLTVDMDFAGPHGDLDLRLHDEHGALAAASYGVNEDGRVSFEGLAPGHYTLRVVGWNGTAADYALAFSAAEPLISADWAENNYSTSTACDLGLQDGLSEWTNLNIHISSDTDWFRFEIAQDGETGQYARIEFTHALGDLDMKLYHSAGYIRSSTGTTDSEQINLEGLEAGAYYAVIYGYNGATNPDYSLSINVSPGVEIPEDACEQNDSLEDAFDLGEVEGHNQTYTGMTMDNSENEPLKEDWFAFTTVGRGMAGDEVRIEFSHNQGDLDMKLIGPAGLTLAVSEGTGDGEGISLEGTAAGTYYLKVYGYDGTSNPEYTIVFDAPEEPGEIPFDTWEVNDTQAQAYNLQTVVGHHSWDLTWHDGDTADWFRFSTEDVSAAGDDVILSFDDGEGWSIEVRDSSGTVLPTTVNGNGDIVVDLAGHEADTFHGVVIGGDTPAHYTLTFDGPEDLPEWTILAYLNGDDRSGSWSTETYSIMKVNAMEAVDLPDDVQVGILMDRISGYATTNPDWTDTRVGVLGHDANPDVMSTEFTSWGEKNMGMGSTLRDFVNWGTSTLPAENYAVFFFGHGGGYMGALPDYSNGYDMLKPDELAGALSQADDHINIIGFDGCLMGAVEVAYEVSPFVDVYIASEEVEYVPGWDWDEVLEVFADDPFAAADQIAMDVVDTLGTPWYIQTMSATDTGGMGAFTSALSEFVDITLQVGTPNDWDAIEAARDAAPAFDEETFIDLGGFMQEVASRVSTEAVSSAAQNVLDEYEGIILNAYSNHYSEGTGLSIFLPEVGGSISWTYRNLSFADDSHWEDFLDSFTSGEHLPPALPDWAEDNDLMESAHDLGSVSDDSFADLTLTANDQDWFSFDVSPSEDATLIVGADYDEFEGDVTLSLYDGEGTLIETVDGSDGEAAVALEHTESGNYYVHVIGSPVGSFLGYSLNFSEEIPAYPNLQVSIYNVDVPISLDAGDTFAVFASATNSGGADIAPGQEFHVAFYLSANNVLDDGDLLLQAVNPGDLVIDEGLAAGETNPSFGAELIMPEVETGDYYIIARIDSADEIDEGPNGEGDNTAATAGTEIHVTDELPVVGSLAAEPAVVAQNEALTLTAGGVGDLEGPVQAVEFYMDADGDCAFDAGVDTLLGTDGDGSDGWSWSGPAEDFEAGDYVCFARALDDDGNWSEPASTTITVETPTPEQPEIETLTPNPDPVIQGEELTLTADGLSDPDQIVVSISFYRDINGDGIGEPGELLGTDTDGSDGWTWSGEAAWDVGQHTYLARANSDDPITLGSDWVTAVGFVNPQPGEQPVITSLTDSPDPVTQGEELTLTADGVSDPDGSVVSVSFYRDINGDGVGEVSELLGVDTDGSDGWTWNGEAAWDVGQHTYLARAVDDGNPERYSDWASTTGTINAPPPDFEITIESGDDAFTFVDATGDEVTIVYSGGGQAQIRFDGPAADYSDIESISISGAGGKSRLLVTCSGDTAVGSIEIQGRGFRNLEVEGDLGELDLGIRRGKSVRNIIVGGTLGDVDADDVKKINLIQAEDITGNIHTRYIKKLITDNNIEGANIFLYGSKGRIKEMRVGGDIIESRFSVARSIKKVYIDGDIADSTFEAYGYKGKLDRFHVGGDVENSEFSAAGSKGSLGKFYVDGDIIDSEFIASKSIKAIFAGNSGTGQGIISGTITAGRDLKRLECGGALDADMEIGRNIKSIVADELGDCTIRAGGKISKALFHGAVYGTLEASEIKMVRTNDYFRDPIGWQLGESMGPRNSYSDHLFSVKPLRLNKIFDAEGNMSNQVF